MAGTDEKAPIELESRRLAHTGRIPPGPGVYTARAGRVDRGTVVEISLRIDQGRVAEAACLVFGDAPVLICAESACRRIEGGAVAEARRLTGLDLATAAALPENAWDQALTVEDAVKAAFRCFDESNSGT